MSILVKHLEEKIDGIIELKSFENRINIITKLEASENETHRIKSGLGKLKIMKIDIKKELEKIGSQFTSLKQKEKMARFKIEEITELEIELKELESKLKPKLKFKELIFKMLGLNCENE